MATETAPATQLKHIDSTIETLETHVEKESTTGVTSTINSWIKTLSEHKELKGIATDLEKLQDALAKKDGKSITSLLTKLGDETTKAGENAEEGDAKKIKMLGKALTTAAKAIGKMG